MQKDDRSEVKSLREPIGMRQVLKVTIELMWMKGVTGCRRSVQRQRDTQQDWGRVQPGEGRVLVSVRGDLNCFSGC